MPSKSRSMKELEKQHRYNYSAAIKAGVTPDSTSGHWYSRVPSGANEGQILKMPGHETLDKTLKAEKELGNTMVQRGDTLFSYEKGDPRLQMGPRSLDVSAAMVKKRPRKESP